MANYEDYVVKTEDGIDVDKEIADAQQQQQARQADTQAVDWETRYKELEKLNSRQAQTLGEYRKTIDEYILNPTPSKEATETAPPTPVTWDEVVEDPNAAILKAVDAHPAVQEARKLKAEFEKSNRDRAMSDFERKHPDYKELGSSPEFQNWVVEDPTRIELYSRGNQYDLSAADALFRLYKAEKNVTQFQAQADLQQAELVSSSAVQVPTTPQYSRHEYITKLTRAKQGDLDAESWVRAHSANYRRALEEGNVRD